MNKMYAILVAAVLALVVLVGTVAYVHAQTGWSGGTVLMLMGLVLLWLHEDH